MAEDVTEMDCAIIYLRSWLAVRSDDTQGVVAAIGLRSVRPFSVELGLAETANDSRACFIAPPVDGWTLVFADALAFDDAALAALSQTFGEAQAFHCDAKHYNYLWSRARAGHVIRAVGVADGEASCVGQSTTPEPAQPADADEFDVLRIARGWSVDPNQLLHSKALGQLGLRS